MDFSDINLPISPLTEYELIERIGSGTYGDVYKARHTSSGTMRALKAIKIEAADDFNIIQQEITMMKQCDHPNIVKFFSSYRKRDRLWIAMELCEAGSVQDIYQVSGAFNEEQIAFILREILHGLKYLHQNGKVHRDIKGANILLNHDGNVKLADFGVAATLTATMDKRNSFIGTPYWMAPEVAAVERKGGYNHLCDIWAVGIVAIECAELQPPMFDIHPMRALYLMSKSNYKAPTLKEKAKWTATFHNFIKYALTTNPKRRPDATRLLDHPLFQGNLSTRIIRDLLNRLKNGFVRYENMFDDEDDKTSNESSAPKRIQSKIIDETQLALIKARLTSSGFSENDIKYLKSKSVLGSVVKLTDEEIRHIIEVMRNGDLDDQSETCDPSTIKRPVKSDDTLRASNENQRQSMIPIVNEVLMGAGLIKTFDECPLQIISSVQWKANPNEEVSFLFASEQGIYFAEFPKNDTSFEQIYASRTTWLYVKDDMLWSISGKSSSLYRHDLKGLTGIKSQNRPMVQKLEIFRMRKWATSTKMNNIRGCISCSVVENKATGCTFLACLTQQEIHLLQYYDQQKKFMQFKILPVSQLVEKNVFQLIFDGENSTPLLCFGVHRKNSIQTFRFSTLNFENEEVVNVDDGKLVDDLIEIRQHETDHDLIFICRRNRIHIVTLKGKIRQDRPILPELVFDVEIDSFLPLRESILIFHKFGVEGRNWRDNSKTQDIRDETRNFRLIGNGSHIVVESRSKNSTEVDIHVLTGVR